MGAFAQLSGGGDKQGGHGMVHKWGWNKVEQLVREEGSGVGCLNRFEVLREGFGICGKVLSPMASAH